MKKYMTLSVLFACFLGCNKNSIELPPPDTSPIVVKYNVSSNNVALFQVTLKQQVSQTFDSIEVFVTNMSGASISNATFLIEICTDTIGGDYDNCKLQPTISFDTLGSSEERKVFVFQHDGSYINAPGTKVHVGLLSINGSHHPLSGVYYGINSAAKCFADSVYISPSYLRGYILVNGETVFNFKGPDFIYDINGAFDNAFSFQGKMTDANKKLVSTVVNNMLMKDSVSVPVDTAAGSSLDVSLLLKSPITIVNINTLFLHLEK